MLDPKEYKIPETPTPAPDKITPITANPHVEIKGPARLSDLEEQYPFEYGFEESVIEAVRNGEIGLLPVGDIVHVKRTSD